MTPSRFRFDRQVTLAVVITVASRFSMKKVTATTRAIRRVWMLRPFSAVGVAEEVTGAAPCSLTVVLG